MSLRKLLFILLIIVMPIGLFYIYNSPLYVLGELREGSIRDWVFWNFTLALSLGIVIFAIYIESDFNKVIASAIVIILWGLALIHFAPLVLYWDTFTRDGIIRDDIGTPGPKASSYMFLWHLFIFTYSIIISFVVLLRPILRKKSGNIA